MKNNAVLIVDDLDINREILAALFEDEYEVLEAADGEQAISMIDQHKDHLAVVLLDIVMPNKDGFEVLDFMRFNRYSKNIPVILISAAEGGSAELKALKKGADDFIQKPFNAPVVHQRVANMIELYRYKRSLELMIEEQTAKFRDISEFVIDVLMTVMQAKNSDSRTSILRIRNYTRELLEFIASASEDMYDLTPERINLIATASILHDIGEVAVPAEIFQKQPFLSPEEQAILELHTVRGCEIISSMKNIERDEYITTAIEVCKYHHERWDGTGYPEHLVGDDIPLSAQVVGLADTYEGLREGTLTGSRFTHEEALLALENGDYGGFSPVLVESIKIMGDRFAEIHDELVEPDARLLDRV